MPIKVGKTYPMQAIHEQNFLSFKDHVRTLDHRDLESGGSGQAVKTSGVNTRSARLVSRESVSTHEGGGPLPVA